jgi:hypothetical protein
VLWKLFGEDGLKWGLAELAALVIGGPLPAVGVLVTKFVAKLAAEKGGAMLQAPALGEPG